MSPLIAGVLGWMIAGSFRLGYRPGAAPGLSLSARLIVTSAAIAVGLCLAALIMRTHLAVSDEGLADHRLFKVVYVPWQEIVGFEVARPGWLWGGFCVTAVRGDGNRGQPDGDAGIFSGSLRPALRRANPDSLEP
jgi:hypothetical protein